MRIFLYLFFLPLSLSFGGALLLKTRRQHLRMQPFPCKTAPSLQSSRSILCPPKHQHHSALVEEENPSAPTQLFASNRSLSAGGSCDLNLSLIGCSVCLLERGNQGPEQQNLHVAQRDGSLFFFPAASLGPGKKAAHLGTASASVTLGRRSCCQTPRPVLLAEKVPSVHDTP